jgi:hypothetical protein
MGRFESRTFWAMGRFELWDVLSCGTFWAVGRLAMGRFESGTLQELDLLYAHRYRVSTSHIRTTHGGVHQPNLTTHRYRISPSPSLTHPHGLGGPILTLTYTPTCTRRQTSPRLTYPQRAEVNQSKLINQLLQVVSPHHWRMHPWATVTQGQPSARLACPQVHGDSLHPDLCNHR